jgi:hypothetical protein
MKTFALKVLLLLLCIKGTAQTFKAGALAGMVSSQISGDQLVGYNKPGAVAGLFVQRAFDRHWEGEMQVYYVQKGSRKVPDPVNNDPSYYRLRLNYVEIPFLARYWYKNIGPEAGVSFSGLLGWSVENELGPYPGGDQENRSFRPFELSYYVGVTLFQKSPLQLSFRLNRSILPVRKHASDAVWYFNRGQYSDVLFFTLRYIWSNQKHN